MKQIPIEVAKRVAVDVGADAVIVIAFCGDQFATTSYGRDRKHCQVFAKVADIIHDDIAYGAIDIPSVETFKR